MKNRYKSVLGRLIRNKSGNIFSILFAAIPGIYPLAVPAASAPVDRPNIVIIFADDLGYGDVGCYGSQQIKTPNLDRLSEQGVRLTQCYSSAPVCTPSRAALMTGAYQQRFGRHFDWVIGGMGDDSGLPPGTVTLPQVLKENGYATGMAGKWHIGGVESRAPNAFGFEVFKGLRGGNLDYWTYRDNQGRLDLWNNTEKCKDQEGYLTDLIADWSIDFIEQNQDHPFFLYAAFTSPHWPYQGKKTGLRNIERESYAKAGGTQEIFNDMVESLDENIGRILNVLEESGLTRRTLVIFSSDNGGIPPFASNGSLRGHKAQLYEGGIRVPGILRWPGRLPAGRVSDQPVITMDLTATALAAAEVFWPANAQPLDGIDVLPILSGATPKKERSLYWFAKNTAEAPPFWRALRQGDFKLLQINNEVFLYDLENDPGEKTNLIEAFPEKARRLKQQYAQWESLLPPREKEK